MKLTEKNLTDNDLSCMIATAEFKSKLKQPWWDIIFECLLELKQRRAEDRAKEARHANG